MNRINTHDDKRSLFFGATEAPAIRISDLGIVCFFLSTETQKAGQNFGDALINIAILNFKPL